MYKVNERKNSPTPLVETGEAQGYIHWAAFNKKCFNPCLYTQIYTEIWFLSPKLKYFLKNVFTHSPGTLGYCVLKNNLNLDFSWKKKSRKQKSCPLPARRATWALDATRNPRLPMNFLFTRSPEQQKKFFSKKLFLKTVYPDWDWKKKKKYI